MKTITLIFLSLLFIVACDDSSEKTGQYINTPLILSSDSSYQTEQCGKDIYPCPPYGTRLYQTLQNSPFLPANEMAQSIADADGIARMKYFYDLKDQGYKLLFIATSTEWCEHCEAEMETLDEMVALYGFQSNDPRVAFLVACTENDALENATVQTASDYSDSHNLGNIVPVTNDGNYFFRSLMETESYPTNIFVDLSSMEIIAYSSALETEQLFSEKLDEILSYIDNK